MYVCGCSLVASIPFVLPAMVAAPALRALLMAAAAMAMVAAAGRRSCQPCAGRSLGSRCMASRSSTPGRRRRRRLRRWRWRADVEAVRVSTLHGVLTAPGAAAVRVRHGAAPVVARAALADWACHAEAGAAPPAALREAIAGKVGPSLGIRRGEGAEEQAPHEARHVLPQLSPRLPID